MTPLVLALLLAGQAPTLTEASCTKDAQGYCIDPIVKHSISYTREHSRLRINCALGDVVSLSFPGEIQLRGEPALGNRAIFEYRAQEQPFRILVWPKMPKGAAGVTPEMLNGERSNLQIFLDSGVTVMVDLKIAPANQAVQQVVFDFPARERESEFLTQSLADQARKLTEAHMREKEEIETTVVERAERIMARGLLERLQCEDLSERAMHDLLVVRAHRLCRIGSRLFVEFEIHNRARDLFHLDHIEIVAAGLDEGIGHVDPIVELEREAILAFDERVRGVATFNLEGEPAREYELTVFEEGGKKRRVTVDTRF